MGKLVKRLKVGNFVEFVECILSNLKNLGCNMSRKIRYPYSHLERFLENLGDVSEDQGKKIYQDIGTIEDRY